MYNWNRPPFQTNNAQVRADLANIESVPTKTKNSLLNKIILSVVGVITVLGLVAAIGVPTALAVTNTGPLSTESSTIVTGSTRTTTTTSTTTATTTSSTTTSSTTTSSTTSATTSSTTSTATTTTVTTALLTTISYSASFTSGVTPTTQCTNWQSFVAQLTVRTYASLIVQGTYNTVGLSTNDSTVIGNIAQALRTTSSYGPTTSNGISWAVGSCGSGIELSASGATCACPSTGYSVRPCIANTNYGGVNTAICSGPSQTMTVIFRY